MLHPGDRITHFELPDLAGRIWLREDLLRRPAVLFFFSSW
jgi:peroxiredoxin